MASLKLFFQAKIKDRKWRVIFASLSLFLLYIFHGIYVWFNSQSTDNAYLQANITFVSPEISGVVDKIYYVENQKVLKGDLLLKVKDIQYQAHYNKAQLALSQSKLGTSIADSAYKIAISDSEKIQAGLKLAELNLITAQREYTRISKLAQDNFSSKKLLDDASLALQKAQTELKQAQLSLDSAKQNIILLTKEKEMSEEKYKSAKEDLIIVQNNYENTKILAPIDGIITSNSARLGGYIRTASPIFAIVPKNQYYIKANFKETQISKFKSGMTAKINLDGIKGKSFDGKIRNIYPATGANFSLIPTDSATGNFTKIVQRVPVIIDIEIPEKYLEKIAIGYSAHVQIRTD